MTNGCDIGPEGAPQPRTGHDEALDEEARRWFLLSLSDRYTAQDAANLKAWRSLSPRHDAAYRAAAELWRDSGALRDAFAAPRTQDASAQVARSGTATNRRHAIAGTLLAACIALFAVFFASDIRIWLAADFRTGDGEITAFSLPDGSRAILNTDSAIAFDFSESRRGIAVLRGEAMFEVRKDPARPFAVEALEGTATALGTVFVVRAKDDRAIVTVSEGKVAVAGRGAEPDAIASGEVVMLNAAQRTTYHQGDRPLSATQVDPESIAPWRRNMILIDGLPFVDAVAELNRYRPGKILVAADTSRLEPVTARFSVSDVEGAIDALAATHGLKVDRFTSYLTLVH